MGCLMAKMDKSELNALVAGELSAAKAHDRSDLSAKRARAIEYYRGDMADLPAEPGRSSATSRDFADVIGWMLPGIIRTLTASGDIVEFEPETPEDEAAAGQASDYCNYVFMKDNPGYRIIHDGTHDSLRHGNAVGKIWFDDAVDETTVEHTRVTAEQIALLQQEEGVEVIASTMNEEPDLVPVADPATGQEMLVPIETYDIRVKRTNKRGRVKVKIIPPEDFFKSESTIDLAEARFTAHREIKTRSELIEMGFRRADVNDLPAFVDNKADSEESIARAADEISASARTTSSEDEVELFECYLRADVNGDDVSELLCVYYAGNSGQGSILDWYECDDEHPFFDIPCNPIPHDWVAGSIFDETEDVQRIKTALFRQGLDSLYMGLTPTADVEENAIVNMDALINPTIGGVIIRKKGSLPVNWQVPPNTAENAFRAAEFFDTVIEKRTGVSKTTMALDPEALQNQTATANQNARDAAYSQIELVARNQAELGWRVMFRKMLRLLVKHQDRPRTIRLRNEWVEMDPREWNANMDCTVNVGLGTGSRDRDMAMLNNVLMNQNALVQAFMGAGMRDKAVGMLPKVLNTMRRIAESAGLKSVDSYYPEIPEQEIQQMMAMAGQPQPDPKLELEKQKLQLDQARAQAEMALKEKQVDAELMLRREQLAAEMGLKREQMQAEMALKAELGVAGAVTRGIGSSIRLGGAPG